MFNRTALDGQRVRLEPLEKKHKADLCKAIENGRLWELFVTLVPHPDNIDAFFDRAEHEFSAGLGVTYATIDKHSGLVAGSSRFMKTVPEHKRTEIGFTFLGSDWQKSGINIESKLLMLRHAFGFLALNRVELLTDVLNHSSRTAIEKLGARQEGMLRQHMVMPDGRVRDSLVYSIVRSEWPSVEQHLRHRLQREA